MNVHYRLTIFDGTLASDSSTALTPASGSSHTDAFRISTIPNLSGYRPYLREPQIKMGTFDIRSARADVGTVSVECLDAKVSGSNTERWISAFVGDERGSLSILGKKALLEESFDTGSNWSPVFVGRVNKLDLASLLTFNIELGDSMEILKTKLFESIPDVDYSVHESLVPVGLTADLVGASGSLTNATILGTPGLRGVVGTVLGGNAKDITLTPQSHASPLNLFPHTGERDDWRLRTDVGDFRIHQLGWSSFQIAKNVFEQRVNNIQLRALPSGSPHYAPLSALSNGSTIDFHVFSERGQYWIGESPYTIAADILDGEFFKDGSLVVPYTFGTLETTQPLPDVLYRVPDPISAIEFLENHICRPFQLGYVFEPVVDGGVAYSRMRFFSTRLPESLSGLTTITGADVVATGQYQWESDEPVLYVEGKFYSEQKNSVSRTSADSSQPTPPATVETSYVALVGFVTGSDATYKPESFEFLGIRSIESDATLKPSEVEGQGAHLYAKGLVMRHLTDYFDRNKSGNPRVSLTCHRNSTIRSLAVGDFVLVEVEAIPNQAIHQRFGTRLMQIVGHQPRGITAELELVDSGINGTMNAPTLNGVSGSNGTISVSVSTSEAAHVEYEVGVVTAGGGAPGAASLAWVLRGTEFINSTTSVKTFDEIPNGKTTYVRVRSKSPAISDLKLPSAWVVSSGVTLNDIQAPTDVTLSAVHAKGATVDWVNTESLPIEVWLGSPSGSLTDQVALLQPDSTRYRLRGLDRSSSPQHTVGIRYRDPYTGYSDFATADFVASGDPPQLDAPAAIILYISNPVRTNE